MFDKIIKNKSLCFLLSIAAICPMAKADTVHEAGVTNCVASANHIINIDGTNSYTAVSDKKTTKKISAPLDKTPTQTIEVEGVPFLIQKIDEKETLSKENEKKEEIKQLLSNLKKDKQSHPKQADIEDALSFFEQQEISQTQAVATVEKVIQQAEPSLAKIDEHLATTNDLASSVSDIPVNSENVATVTQNNKDDVKEMLDYLDKEVPPCRPVKNNNELWLGLGVCLLGSIGIAGAMCLNDKKHYKTSILPSKEDNPDENPQEQKLSEEKNEFHTVDTPLQTSEPQTDFVSANQGRKERAEWIWAVKKIDEIKKERAKLKQMRAKAKKQDDKETLTKIKDRRQELTAKRREMCLRANSQKWAEIKERRRLLTKQMTLARRNKDTETMDKITAERESIKNHVKEMNAQIKAFDYTKQRASLLKKSVWENIQAHR